MDTLQANDVLLTTGQIEPRELPGGLEYLYSCKLRAPVGKVFQALTAEVMQWWPHTCGEKPYAIVLETTIGGRFYEQFDVDGAGALYGHVEIYEPPVRLRIRGPMAMGHAINMVYTIKLEECPEGTLLLEEVRASGAYPERFKDGVTNGSIKEYGTHLRNWVEQGKAIR
jgi:uncharacterized protein YndB with AHSA1/START domain